MSFLRKTVLTTAVIGAGLVSTAGAAFACDNPGGDEHHGSHHGSHSTTVDSNNDSSCSNGVGTGHKTGNGGLVGVGNVLDAPITANVCHVLENNGNGNGSGNTLNVGGSDSGVPGLSDLGGLLGGGTSAAPSAQTFQAAPAQAAPVQQAAPAQAAPVQQAAPTQASAVPAGTTTTPIQG